MTLDDYVPIENFGADHWSTLAYAETVMVECAGFQVGYDPRMRQGRRHYRVMYEQCKRPKRPNNPSMGMVMDDKYSTPLKDGTVISGHDDWHCIQDCVNAGLLGVIDPNVDGGVDCDANRVEPGVMLALSAKGHEINSQLRKHKAEGGRWKTFEPELAA
jgi:hypothetical protein